VATADYVPLEGRARTARGAIWTVIMVEIGVIAADAVVLDILGVSDPGQDELDAANIALGLSALAELVTSLIAAVFFIRWFSAAYRNLDVLCPGTRRYAAGWAIWGWFVPIMSLFRPKQIANDIATCDDKDAKSQWWLKWWWVAWIAASLISNGAGRASFDAERAGELRSVATLDLVASVLSIVAGLLVFKVLRHFTEIEERLRAQLVQHDDDPTHGFMAPDTPIIEPTG
jgi:Domain of unknown function (DUF4328)